MQIAFRTDASIQIGTGHVMRCLTLANALAKQGAACTFVCRDHPGHLAQHITDAGHDVHLLPAPDEPVQADAAEPYGQWVGGTQTRDAQQTLAALPSPCDWLVVDHYGLDTRWETLLRRAAQKILVIDDLANRAHDCDLLLDQNLGRESTDYDGLVTDRVHRLIGPSYALLRPEFAGLREYSLARRKQPRLRHLLITMGGVDKGNATGEVLESLRRCRLPTDCRVTVVMGPHAPWLGDVNARAATFPRTCEVKTNIANMAQLMADTDLAIGAAGTTSWERCCLGVPSLVVVLADNQRQSAHALSERKAALTIERPNQIHITALSLLSQPNSLSMLKRMGIAAAAINDGRGNARVCLNMQQ